MEEWELDDIVSIWPDSKLLCSNVVLSITRDSVEVGLLVESSNAAAAVISVLLSGLVRCSEVGVSMIDVAVLDLLESGNGSPIGMELSVS